MKKRYVLKVVPLTQWWADPNPDLDSNAHLSNLPNVAGCRLDLKIFKAVDLDKDLSFLKVQSNLG